LTAKYASEVNSYFNRNFNGSGIRFTEGYNLFLIQDDNSPIGMRQIREGELVLLSVPRDSIACAGWGSYKPIPARFVLTRDEVAQINTAVANFNAVINTACAIR